MGGSIGNIFSGGAQNAEAGLANADQGISSYLQNMFNGANSNYQPYTTAGQNAISGYNNFTNGLQSQMNGNWMKDYQESPYATFLTNKETNAANNAAAAGGTLGTGANQQQNMSIANNITDSDMQNYFNNMQSQNQQYLGAQGHLMDNGLSSAQGQGGLATSFGNAISNMMSNQAQASAASQMAGQQGKNSGIGGLISGANSGSGKNSGAGAGFSSPQQALSYLFA